MYNINRNVENRLVEENIGLVVFIANKFRPPNLSSKQWIQIQEDYIQVGQIGLLKAIRAHNPKRSKCLSTSAWVCIYREILGFIKKEKNHMTISQEIPSRTHEVLWEYCPSLSDLEYQVINYRIEGYTYKEIGSKLNYSKTWVNKIFQKAAKKIKQANI